MFTESYLEEVERKKQRIDKVSFLGDEEEAEKTSSLPSRMELHHSKKKKKKEKIKFPLLKVLLTFFILLPISTILAYTYFAHHTPLKASSNNEYAGNEEISYDTGSDQNSNQKSSVEQPNSTKNIEERENEGQTKKVVDSSDETTNLNTSSNQENHDQIHNNGDIPMIQHVVQPNETLFSIAMKYYHSQTGIAKIIEHNHIVNNEIQVGQTLQIPLMK